MVLAPIPTDAFVLPRADPLRISAMSIVTARGRGCAALLQGLRSGTGGLRRCDFADADLDTWVGRVEGVEDDPITGELAAFDCRNNRLARLALDQDGFREKIGAVRQRHGADRIAVFLGTSTSGIGHTEEAYQRREPETGRLAADFDYQHTHNVFSLAAFTRRSLDLSGPAAAISTACSSSAKAFVSAYRALRAGLCDAAVVGGVDSLCLTTLYGFRSLELTSSQPCRPWDIHRDGLSLGEGAGFVLLERHNRNEEEQDKGLALLGYGETSDGYHMTAMHPEGLGAALAMRHALARADMRPQHVDYINLHGTATPANDAGEDLAVVTVFGRDTPCSSTKGYTGHTLGAAGITEAIICCLCLEHGLLPGTLNTRSRDPALGANLIVDTAAWPLSVVMSNSFGFGGSNCSLIFGRIP
jgi:3-oxoacyl-[acyl-carrier-protein] synthase-1